MTPRSAPWRIRSHTYPGCSEPSLQQRATRSQGATAADTNLPHMPATYLVSCVPGDHHRIKSGESNGMSARVQIHRALQCSEGLLIHRGGGSLL